MDGEEKSAKGSEDGGNEDHEAQFLPKKYVGSRRSQHVTALGPAFADSRARIEMDQQLNERRRRLRK